MLQLCVELSKVSTPSIAANKPLRDVLIKYAWRHLKVPEESPCRHWAFLATVHLLPLVDARASQSGDAQRQRQLQQQQSDKQQQQQGEKQGEKEKDATTQEENEKEKEKEKAAEPAEKPQRQSTAGGGGSTATSMGAVVPSAGGTAAAAAGGGERERSHARPAGTERMVAQVGAV
jgi:uncharacterized phage infection (PIP) family protein YhgE